MASHRYWRLLTNTNYGAAPVTVTELFFYRPGGGLATGSGTPSASTNPYPGTNGPDKAFDGNGTGSQYQSADGDIPNWVKYDFGVTTDIGTVGLQNYSGNATFFSQAVKFQWSDDDAAWTDYVAFTNPNTLNTITLTSPGGNLSAAITMPMGTVRGMGGLNGAATQTFSVSGRFGINAAATAPAAQPVGYGGINAAPVSPFGLATGGGGASGAITAPMGTVLAAGSPSTLNEAAISMPMALVAAAGGAHGAATWTSLCAVSASATGMGWAHGAATLSAPFVLATGTACQVGRGDPYLSLPLFRVIGYGGAMVSVTIGGCTVAARGTTGGVGSAQITLPLYEVLAFGSQPNHGSADILCPAGMVGGSARAALSLPSALVVAIGSAVVAVTYEAYSINLNRALDRNPANQYDAQVDEITRYTNYPFDRIVRYQNSYLGVAADGLYLLEGATDNGTAIPYAVRTCITDFGSPEKKTVESVYLAGRLGATATVTHYVGDNTPEAHAFSTPRDATARTHRQKFGRGVKNRYHAVGVAGSDKLTLDTIDFNVGNTKRRL